MEIARLVGATRKRTGYMEGGGYLVTWALGHLVQLALPSFYGHTKGTADNLPFMPDPFCLVIRQRKGEKGTATDSAAARQLKAIGDVLSHATSVVAATDAGREGELIFRNIYAHLGCTLPVRRLWISSLTPQAIRAGLDSMREGRHYDNLYRAADCRAKADWLVGINASQALAAASGLSNNSLGRVQTPTLALICARYRDNRGFTPSDYWELYAVLQKDDALRKFRYTGELPSKEQAEALHARIAAAGTATITRSERKPISQAPPLLYDLTALQKDCNVRFDMSPEQTLEAAQSLYEAKLITYPRTGSRHIPDDIMETVPDLIRKALAMPAFAHMKGVLKPSALFTGSVDGEKVTDHHALLTTGVKPEGISDTDMQVYTLIAARMLEAFAPACLKEALTMEAEADGEHFISRSSVITSPGWRAVQHQAEEHDDESAEGEGEAIFDEGETAEIGGCSLATKKTRPRPLYTEATLLTAMEKAGKEVGDDDARAAMRDCGLGTPATRAAIIATLFRREYISRIGKSLVPTEKGLFVYESVKDMRIADAQLTGEWEHALACIEAGEMEPVTFLDAIRVYTKQVTAEILSLDFLGSTEGSILCPKCGKSYVTIRQKVAKCGDPACGLVVFRHFLNKDLTEQHLQQLFSSGATKLIKGLKGKSGKAFDARLAFDKDFSLTFAPDEKKPGKGAKSGMPPRSAKTTANPGK